MLRGVIIFCFFISCIPARELQVRVSDLTGAPIPAATLRLACEGGHPQQTSQSDTDGYVRFDQVPAVLCTLQVSSEKLASATQRIDLRQEFASVDVQLVPARAKTEIVVAAGPGGIETSSTAASGTLDREQLAQLPIFNRATGFTDILTRTTPGVAADSNGFAHPLGEHADTSISLDGQPITDQQAKVFSNQIDPNIIEALTATTGAPPAEFGGKTSLVVSVTTKSGLGAKSAGFVASDYGTFGNWNESAGWAKGNDKWGNFLTVGAGGSELFLIRPSSFPFTVAGTADLFSTGQTGIRDQINFCI